MPPDLFIFLRRAWSFERHVTCRKSFSEHRASGRAVWASITDDPDSLSLSQTEEGTLILGNAGDANSSAAISVRAAYNWSWSPSRNDATISFPDGRTFLEGINFVGGACSAHHDCSPDKYEGTFTRTEDGTGFCIAWSVVGPRKDYSSTTTYLPLQD